LAEEAVAITRKWAESGDPLALMAYGFTLNNLAATLLKLGRPADAVPVAQEAVDSLQRASELGMWAGRGVDLTAQANLAAAQRKSRGGSKGKKWFRRRSTVTTASAPPSSDSWQPVHVDANPDSIFVTRWGHRALEAGLPEIRAVGRLQDNLHPLRIRPTRGRITNGLRGARSCRSSCARSSSSSCRRL
jgi:hypothetical protein